MEFINHTLLPRGLSRCLFFFGDMPSQLYQLSVSLVLSGHLLTAFCQSSNLVFHSSLAINFDFRIDATLFVLVATLRSLLSSKPLCVPCRTSLVLDPSVCHLLHDAKLPVHRSHFDSIRKPVRLFTIKIGVSNLILDSTNVLATRSHHLPYATTFR